MASNTIDSYFIEIKLGPFTKKEYEIKINQLKKLAEENRILNYFNKHFMNTKLEQKKREYEETKKEIARLQKLRKSLYNHIYIIEMREKQKKV